MAKLILYALKQYWGSIPICTEKSTDAWYTPY